MQQPSIIHEIDKVVLQVLTMSAEGETSYEEVYMFSHRQSTVRTAFVSLVTTAGAKITASPGHYIHASSKARGASMQPKRAQDIQIGDYLLELDPTGARGLPAQVMAKYETVETGLYNPHVASGSIVVNNVGALTFTDTLPPSLAIHKLITAPGHLLYTVLKAVGGPAAADAVNNALLSLYFNAPRFAWLTVVSGK